MLPTSRCLPRLLVGVAAALATLLTFAFAVASTFVISWH